MGKMLITDKTILLDFESSHSSVNILQRIIVNKLILVRTKYFLIT